MATQYRIGEFSNLSGVSTKTLRFYDEIGLLRPASVDSRTGYRHYRAEQLEQVASILALKQLGVSLAEVRGLLSRSGSGKDRRSLLLELKSTIEQSIDAAGQTLNFISLALEELDRVKRPIPVVVKRVPAVPVASVRARVNSYEEILRFEQELLHGLPTQSVGDLRGVLWHRCADSGGLEGEPFVALKGKVPAQSFYDVKQLPASTVACAYSGLDDESAEQSYRAIRKWMDVRGYQLAGPKREISHGSILEIQFPLKCRLVYSSVHSGATETQRPILTNATLRAGGIAQLVTGLPLFSHDTTDPQERCQSFVTKKEFGNIRRIEEFRILLEPNLQQKEWEHIYEGREFSICGGIRGKLI